MEMKHPLVVLPRDWLLDPVCLVSRFSLLCFWLTTLAVSSRRIENWLLLAVYTERPL